MDGSIWRSAEWTLLASVHHHVPGRTARRTWLRVQLPAVLRCGYVGSFVGRRRPAANLLVMSMVTRGVALRRRRETPDLLCDKSRRWPGRWRARVLEGKLWHPRFLKTFARIGAALGLPAVWMASLRQN